MCQTLGDPNRDDDESLNFSTEMSAYRPARLRPEGATGHHNDACDPQRLLGRLHVPVWHCALHLADPCKPILS